MNTKKFAFILIALILGTTTLFAQGWRNFNRQSFNYGYGPGACLNYLPDLTETQKAKISALESAHQEVMAELRIKQRSTYDPVQKIEIRDEMLQKVQTHRGEVKNLLTEEQQKQYDLLHTRNNYGGRGVAQGKRPGRGQAGYGGRGYRGW